MADPGEYNSRLGADAASSTSSVPSRLTPPPPPSFVPASRGSAPTNPSYAPPPPSSFPVPSASESVPTAAPLPSDAPYGSTSSSSTYAPPQPPSFGQRAPPTQVSQPSSSTSSASSPFPSSRAPATSDSLPTFSTPQANKTKPPSSAPSSAPPSHPQTYGDTLMALDAYSLPTVPIMSEPARPRSYFDGATEGRGEAIYAVDHLKDDMEGSEVSTPFVAFSAESIPSNRRIANTASLGFGALACPAREVLPAPPLVRTRPVRCEFCGAFANLYCLLVPKTGEWKCALCNKGNDSRGEYQLAEGENYSGWPELNWRVVDYMEAGGRRFSASDTALAVPVVLLIDETLHKEHLKDLQKSLLEVVESLPPLMRVGIVTFGQTVSVYDLKQPGVAVADVFPGNVSPSLESKNILLFGSGIHLAPIHTCLPLVHAVISSLRPYKGKKPEVERSRCLGVALEIALALVRGPATGLPRGPMKRTGGSSRVVVCLGGPSTLGPGSVPVPEGHPNRSFEERKAMKYMTKVGQEAKRLEAAVDILCGGTCPLSLPILLPLTTAANGVLLLHDDFREGFAANAAAALKRVVGVKARLELRMSPCLALTRVMGPAEAAKETHSTTPTGEPQFEDDTATVLEMASVEDGQALALSLELLQDTKESHVYFQFVVTYTSVSQAAVTRVITIRIVTTPSVSTYLKSLDEEVAAVLIAKRTVLAAAEGSDLPEVRRMLDDRVRDLAAKFGKPLPKSRFQRFPNELPRLAEALFHLRRGPLLGSIIGHEDERQVLRTLFLRCDLNLALRMMQPQLLLFRQGQGLQEVPPYALALHSGNALVLDHGTDIFSWMGADLAADSLRFATAEAACAAIVKELALNRFPSPRILHLKEHTSAARYLMARLIPAHKDTPSEQETRFPPLRELSPEDRFKLKAKLLPTDEPSFCEWMKSLRLVPPEPGTPPPPPVATR
eukprot:TRINITY_DN24108_c0_g1_i1.p1 TRINITY_DN24108_c0_g1~~TRINITY_DN24108_c0_g1_i1.p1  ORF type:complete len:952 (-),score=173.17 TRINITY_DN24108_c0_g1_i1:617-3472(-)